MIKLKQYAQPNTVSIESLVNTIDTLEHASISLEAFPHFYGLESDDTKSTFEKVKEFIKKILLSVGRLLSELWDKLTGSNQEERLEETERKLLTVEKVEPEVTEEVSEAIEELVKENQTLSKEPKVPEGLPKNLFTRLITTHDAFYNVGVMVFQNDVVKDTDYYHKLAVAVVELIGTHHKAITRVVNDRSETYVEDVTQSASYKEVVKLLSLGGVTLTDFKYSEAFYELNRLAHEYVKSPYFVLDVDVNSVYKAKLGELKQGLKVMREKIKDDAPLRNRANQQEALLTKFAKSLKDEDDFKVVKTYATDVSQLVKMLLVVTRLRQQAFNVNIDFIDAVIAVSQHPSFKKK